MCDYSLMAVPSRLAVSGDELVVHRFDAKSMGLAAACEVRRATEVKLAGSNGFRARLRSFLRPSKAPIRTVCIPPGARVLIRDIPTELQRECGIMETAEEAVFTQISAAEDTFRDAVRFQNGVVVLLQRLHQGQSVRVLDLSSAEQPVAAQGRRKRVTT
jgi:hypothetical protein